MTTFWSWYVTILTLGTIIALVWLIFATRKGQAQETNEKTMGHSFDGIEEYDNPLPKWWFFLFVGTIVFALGYLVLYPGLGNWKGVLPGYQYLDNTAETKFDADPQGGWTGVHQWEKEMLRADEEYGPIYARFADMSIEEIAKDPQAQKMGNRLFANHCALCHGSDAKGAFGFPNLTDNEWRWGGTTQDIQNTINNGRMGIMAPHGPILGSEERVRNVAAYVYTELMGRDLPEGQTADIAEGQQTFATVCFACHGADGKGNHLLGSANLTNPAALIYGTSLAQLQQTIRYGRNGTMPAQGPFLGEDKVRLLTAYVYSLSHGGTEAN